MLTKSCLKLARVALAAAEQALPRYSSKYSRHDFTLPQLTACLLVQRFYRLDLRGAEVLLVEHESLRQVLGLKSAPDHTTLWRAQRRLPPPRLGRLLDETVRMTERSGLIRPSGSAGSTLALDSTSLASGWTSRHFFRFKTRPSACARGGWRGYPKWSIGVDTRSHLLLAQVADVGPRHDTCEVQELVLQAQHRRSSRMLLADAGYDSAQTLQLCHTQRLRPIIRVKPPPNCPHPSRVQNPERRHLLRNRPVDVVPGRLKTGPGRARRAPRGASCSGTELEGRLGRVGGASPLPLVR
ncbi:transposase [Corallococcus carmarthensis]|uniref:Transposase IS4-like domain-containing protein n=1 Tax=Corallococcus carmarthensis TaxID=2316728 RepID=A0A3A8JZ83_9BACT|nr:hypothetical protein D7X32_21060 [Corallococcus carmarthensis]